MKIQATKAAKKAAKKVYKKRVAPALKTVFKIDRKIGSPLNKGLFKLIGSTTALGYVPGLRERIPYFDPEKTNISWLPINQEIDGGGGVALPFEILDRLIDKSSARAIIDGCVCRKINDCSDYPADVGCLFLGASAREISPKLGREASVEEAKAHARKAIGEQLVPMVGKMLIDKVALKVEDGNKLLTVCFCCECCCITQHFARGPHDLLDSIHSRLEGLSLEVTDDCIGCGECASSCYIDAINLKGGRAIIEEQCRICGRCVSRCPEDAIRLEMEHPGAIDDFVRRFEPVVG